MSTTYIAEQLRRAVATRAKNSCEYCLIPAFFSLGGTYHIDHIIAERHRGSSSLDNLAYSCPLCNISKGSNLSTYLPNFRKTVPPFNPRLDVWSDHFSLDASGLIQCLTDTGFGTVFLLKMNLEESNIMRRLLLENGVNLVPSAG